MKSVLISIQPYYVYLIIARLMGWDIPQEKTIEVRKDFPKDSAWNKKTLIYCSKNRKSFNRIPKEYQPLMAKFLGKVIGEFVCNNIRKGGADNLIQAYYHNNPDETCLTDKELVLYATTGKPIYYWHISDLKIYDKPKEPGKFRKPAKPYQTRDTNGSLVCLNVLASGICLTSPPQSWCYVELSEV